MLCPLIRTASMSISNEGSEHGLGRFKVDEYTSISKGDISYDFLFATLNDEALPK